MTSAPATSNNPMPARGRMPYPIAHGMPRPVAQRGAGGAPLAAPPAPARAKPCGISPARLLMSPVVVLSLIHSAAADSVAPPPPNPWLDIFTAAAPAVVKLYGGGISLEHGYGVGVLVSADGRIVTVSSLLLDGSGVRAVLHDGREFQARVLHRNEQLHLALLQIDADSLPFLTPAASASLQPGDPVIALGNSYKIAEGDEPVSLVRGVFSLRTGLAARRRKQTFDYRGDVLIYDAITSNPGMAGGPLLDLDGRWIGLIGKVVVSDRTNTYLSYALPCEVVTDFLRNPQATSAASAADQPINEAATSSNGAATAKRAYSGIHLFELGRSRQAAYIDRVAPGSPAATAGLRPDDLILAVDATPVKSTSDMKRNMSRWTPGQRISLAIRRGEQVIMVDLQLEAEP